METYNVAILYRGCNIIKNFYSFANMKLAEKCARALIKRNFKIKIDFPLKSFSEESGIYFMTYLSK